MPIELSSTDVILFVTAVLVFSAYHAWFFISTTVADSRHVASEAEQRALQERLDAVHAGQLIEIADYQKARQLNPD